MFYTIVSAIRGTHGQTTLQANYNIGGITGKASFTQASVGNDVSVNLELDNVPNGNYELELHEYRVNYDTADPCSNTNIGAK